MRVLLTGATGFVGRAVAAELAHESHDVVALVRGIDPERRAANVGLDVRVHPGALEDSASLRAAMQGVEVVVHVAAIVDPTAQRDRSAVLRVNRDLTLELASVAQREGARRFVFMSSIAAMGFWPGLATSESVCRPTPGYGEAKLAAERGLVAMQGNGFEVVILRPPTVYGPGERYNFLTWVRAVDQGLFRIIGAGDNAFPLVTTKNLACATRAAVEGRLEHGIFLVTDDEPYSMTRIHAAIARACGRRPPRLRLPIPVALAAGTVNEKLAAVLPVPLILSRDRVRTLTVDQRFDVEPLRRAGVDLDAPLEGWVELTVRDYERRGLLRGRSTGRTAFAR